jgi:hypothetical protein
MYLQKRYSNYITEQTWKQMKKGFLQANQQAANAPNLADCGPARSTSITGMLAGKVTLINRAVGNRVQAVVRRNQLITEDVILRATS